MPKGSAHTRSASKYYSNKHKYKDEEEEKLGLCSIYKNEVVFD